MNTSVQSVTSSNSAQKSPLRITHQRTGRRLQIFIPSGLSDDEINKAVDIAFSTSRKLYPYFDVSLHELKAAS